jgi:predicted metal-binding membrane protein
MFVKLQANLSSKDLQHTPTLLQVLVLLLAFSYAYLTYILIKSQLERSAAQEHTPPLLQVENALSTPSCLLDVLSGRLALLQCQSR